MSPRRRSHTTTSRLRANAADRSAPPTDQLADLIVALQETVVELKSDILMLTRKIVSLEAELDYVQGKRGL